MDDDVQYYKLGKMGKNNMTIDWARQEIVLVMTDEGVKMRLIAEWTSVKDRFPPNTMPLHIYAIEHLVIRTNGDIRVAWHGTNNRWYDGDWGDIILDVTHWTPLPEPPEDTI